MRRTRGIIILLFFIASFMLQAQETQVISKTEVLSKVLKNNRTLKISKQEFQVAKASFKQTNAVYLPNITASHTGISTTNPLMAFGSKLNQGILTQTDFNPAFLNNPKRTQNFATKLEVQQPLLNLDGFYQRKGARINMMATSLKNARTQEYLVFKAEKAYLELQLAHKGVAVVKKTLQAAIANKQIADNRFKEGLLQRSDILNVALRITEVRNQLQSAKRIVLDASNYLSFLMTDTRYITYLPTDSLTVNNAKVAVLIISDSRADIKAMQLVSKASEVKNKADKMAFLPRLNAFGSYELYDNKVFQGSASGYIIGAQLSWDIFKGAKRFGKVQQSNAELEKSKLEYKQYVSESNLELQKVKRQLADAKERLVFTDLAVQQSKEALRIIKNRFREGLEKTTDLLLAEVQFAQKQLAYYQTIFEYNTTQAYVAFLTKE